MYLSVSTQLKLLRIAHQFCFVNMPSLASLLLEDGVLQKADPTVTPVKSKSSKDGGASAMKRTAPKAKRAAAGKPSEAASQKARVELAAASVVTEPATLQRAPQPACSCNLRLCRVGKDISEAAKGLMKRDGAHDEDQAKRPRRTSRMADDEIETLLSKVKKLKSIRDRIIKPEPASCRCTSSSSHSVYACS